MNSTAFIEPIHINRFNNGRLYKVHQRRLSELLKPEFLHTEILTVHTHRNKQIQPKRKSIFNYRKWYESSVNYATQTARPSTSQYNSLKRIVEQYQNRSGKKKSFQISSPDNKFKRNLKHLKEKVKIKISKALLPSMPTQKMDTVMRSEIRQVQGLRCNSIIAWRKRKVIDMKNKVIVSN